MIEQNKPEAKPWPPRFLIPVEYVERIIKFPSLKTASAVIEGKERIGVDYYKFISEDEAKAREELRVEKIKWGVAIAIFEDIIANLENNLAGKAWEFADAFKLKLDELKIRKEEALREKLK